MQYVFRKSLFFLSDWTPNGYACFGQKRCKYRYIFDI